MIEKVGPEKKLPKRILMEAGNYLLSRFSSKFLFIMMEDRNLNCSVRTLVDQPLNRKSGRAETSFFLKKNIRIVSLGILFLQTLFDFIFINRRREIKV